MSNFVTFWSDIFDLVSSFLLSEPIIWFIGILLLICLAGFINKILYARK